MIKYECKYCRDTGLEGPVNCGTKKYPDINIADCDNCCVPVNMHKFVGRMTNKEREIWRLRKYVRR